MKEQLDRLLAAYCSPTLAGIKSASLVACDRALYPALSQHMREYRAAFQPRGYCFEVVCACEKRCLLLVYHRQRLETQLVDARAERLLRQFGYPVGQSLRELLAHLRRRIAACDSFPHEIGLFLGYPVEDVEGFIEHRGRGCKLTGYWKVYGDAEAASKRFDRIARVCRAVTTRVERGESLLHVFAAA